MVLSLGLDYVPLPMEEYDLRDDDLVRVLAAVRRAEACGAGARAGALQERPGPHGCGRRRLANPRA